MRIQHDIFNTPNKINLTIEDQATPSEYASHADELGSTMPMWRVQTEGYKDGNDQLIGLVSRDAGFLDSPDTEWISSGVNSKGPNAVAIGRHANFFHWGFAASPTFMTEEAKLVFINAVHYISRFNGQLPIARKVKGTLCRSSLDRIIDGISEEGYAKTVAIYAKFRKDDEDRKAEIQARIDAGEEVPPSERGLLDYPAVKTPGRFDSIKRLMPKVNWDKFGEDSQAIGEFIKSAMPYIRSEGWYKLVIDEELKQIGIPNNDIRLLEKAVMEINSERGRELGQRLLSRYTAEQFEKPEEWRDWLNQNRKKLFFTEAGGYKWLVNDQLAAPATAKKVLLKPTSQSPVAAQVSAKALGKGRYELNLDVAILKGWHAYDVVGEASAYKPMVISLTLPKGVKQVSAWRRPASSFYPDDLNIRVFKGRFAFECELEGVTSVGQEVLCTLNYQVCDDSMCLPPSEKVWKLRLDARGGSATLVED